jgi:A/G-specific adenine glycosylase
MLPNAMIVARFQKRILTWYSQNKRELPWRHTTDPYAILVSEIMLQQTQVDRVIPYYLRFLKKYPDFKSLSTANTHDLLTLWSGLGYNNRVLRLQRLSKVIVEQFLGRFPIDEDKLLSLPGIGSYTAAAILAFAYNKKAAVIDTNVRRVLIHELKLDINITTEELKKIALLTVPGGKSRIWYNALMDYGALHMTARKTGIKQVHKQSRFEGSERQIRGQILKHLIRNGNTSFKTLKKWYDHPRLDIILAQMEKDGILRQNKTTVELQ